MATQTIVSQAHPLPYVDQEPWYAIRPKSRHEKVGGGVVADFTFFGGEKTGEFAIMRREDDGAAGHRNFRRKRLPAIAGD